MDLTSKLGGKVLKKLYHRSDGLPPYFLSTFPRGTMAQRRRYKRKFSKKNLSIAKKALRKVNKLARRVKPEPKIHDIVQTTIAPTVAGLVNSFVVIAQGAAVTQRVGILIRVFFIELRYSIVKHATPTSTQVRILICRDNRQVESTSPSVLAVLLAATPGSQYSRVNPKRFTILYSKFFTLRTNRIAFATTVTRKLSFNVGYVGAANSTITKNGIFMITESDASGGEEPTMKFTMRLRYTDV